MIFLNVRLAHFDFTIAYGCRVSEGLVESNGEVILKVGRYTTAVFGRVTDDFILGRNHFHIRTIVECIDYYIRILALGKSEAEYGCTLRRDNFGCNIVIRKECAVVIGCRYLRFMIEPACTLVLVEYGLTCNGHNRELSVIINPRTGLMCLFETSDTVRCIGVVGLHSLLYLSCFGRIRENWLPIRMIRKESFVSCYWIY